MAVTLEALASNPVVTLGSFVLAIFGILLATIFYFRSQKNKIPCFEESSNTIIEGLHKSLEGLEVHYKGNVQERITVTKLAFWNNGKETIDKLDMVEKDPLRIKLPCSIDVLDIQIIDVSSNSNSVSIGNAMVTEDEIMYPVNLEYLDQSDFFIIQVIHNGSSKEILGVEGKIKGVKSIIKVSDTRIEPITFQIKPLEEPAVGAFLTSPVFIKYFGSLAYFTIGIFATWNLFNGKTDWYVWLGACFCFLGTGVMYHGYRHVAPVKI